MKKTLKLEAKVERSGEAAAFTESLLKEAGCPEKEAARVALAVEELFVNAASYAYPEGGGEVRIAYSFPGEYTVEITLSDDGIPYDPTTKRDPNLSLPMKQRGVGGLGIFMAKKIMDGMRYERQNDANILVIRKDWKGAHLAESQTFEDLIAAGFNMEEGLTYTGNREKYLAALQRFYRRIPKIREELSRAEEKEDYEAITIAVHALKSNARTIGADDLALLSERMELAGKSVCFDDIQRALPALYTELEKAEKALVPYGKLDEVHPSTEISAEKAEKVGGELIEAVEDFDYDRSLALIDELMRYPFRFTLINVLKNAKEDLCEFEYNDALLKIRRVVSQIED